jgi:hypothetical protein
VTDRTFDADGDMRGLTVEPVSTLPDGVLLYLVTDDGHTISMGSEPDHRLRLCWDEVCGQPFDRFLELRDGSIALFVSPDGRHVAHVGVRRDRGFVGRDGVEGPALENISRSVPPVFGGDHLAYGANLPGSNVRLILDGQPIGENELAPIAATFSPDGSRLAYVEMRGDGRTEVEHRIVLDGQPGEWFRGMRNAAGAMQFSPDSKRFAYYTIDGKGHARWFVDGIGQQVINDVRPLRLNSGMGLLDPPLPARFSPDGRRFVYFADVVEKGVAMVEDDRPGPRFKSLGPPTFSADSRHLTYTGETFSKSVAIVVDGEIVGEWPGSMRGRLTFSPDGNHVATTIGREEGFLFKKRTVYSLAVDDQLLGSELGRDAAQFPTFSPDGAHVAWWVQRPAGDAVALIDGSPHEGPWSVDSEIRFTADGTPIFQAKIGAKSTVVVGYRPGPLADTMVSLRTIVQAFGRDPWITPWTPYRVTASGDVAWAGRFGKKDRPVFDDEVGPEFDAIVACTVETSSVVWWGQRGDTVYRIERSIDGPAPTASTPIMTTPAGA